MGLLNQPKLSLVLSTHATQFESVAYKGDFESNIAKIANWGYDGVELAIRDPDLINVDVLEAILANHGIKVPAIGTGQAWGEEHLSFTNPDQSVRNKAISRIKSHISLAQRLKSLVIIGLIRGMTPPGQTKLQSMRLLEECLRDCAKAASDHGVRLAVEPLNRYETDLILNVDEGLELIHRIDSPNLGLLLDTFHMNIEEKSIEQCIRRSGDSIFHFHVADSNRCYPGGGHLDFKTLLEALKSTGYGGWISGEFMPIPDPDTAAQRSMTYLKQVFTLI
jgi:sugar phosphate isomerase/epimerase